MIEERKEKKFDFIFRYVFIRFFNSQFCTKHFRNYFETYHFGHEGNESSGLF